MFLLRDHHRARGTDVQGVLGLGHQQPASMQGQAAGMPHTVGDHGSDLGKAWCMHALCLAGMRQRTCMRQC
jgi:hypothetical protein